MSLDARRPREKPAGAEPPRFGTRDSGVRTPRRGSHHSTRIRSGRRSSSPPSAPAEAPAATLIAIPTASAGADHASSDHAAARLQHRPESEHHPCRDVRHLDADDHRHERRGCAPAGTSRVRRDEAGGRAADGREQVAAAAGGDGRGQTRRRRTRPANAAKRAWPKRSSRVPPASHSTTACDEPGQPPLAHARARRSAAAERGQQRQRHAGGGSRRDDIPHRDHARKYIIEYFGAQDVICQHCGTEISDKAIVCFRCGQSTSAPVRRAPGARRRAAAQPLWLAVDRAARAGRGRRSSWRGRRRARCPRPLSYTVAALAAVVLVWRILRRRRT